jgi:hypothetical protein
MEPVCPHIPTPLDQFIVHQLQTETGIYGARVHADVIGVRSTSEIKTALLTVLERYGRRLKRVLLAPPRLTGWTPFPTRALQFIAYMPIFLF